MVGTTKQFAEKLNVDYQVMQGLFKFLSIANLIKQVGEEKTKNGKGRAATIWEVPETITLQLSKGTNATTN